MSIFSKLQFWTQFIGAIAPLFVKDATAKQHVIDASQTTIGVTGALAQARQQGIF